MPNTCVRSFSPSGGYTPGLPTTVTLTCTIGTGVSTYIVEDTYPVGWTIGTISDGGGDNGVSVRWFFLDATNRVLTYQVTPPLLETGAKTFSGKIDSDDSPSNFQTAVTGGTTSYGLLILVPHPADTTVGSLLGNSDFKIQAPEILAYAAAFLAGDSTKFPGVTANRTAYVLRAAAIFLANSQSRYTDNGTAAPVDDPMHPARWQESPDI